ncbi:MAG: Gfo/Idh/MocA family oxidoreductase [Planctomycetaceae bacterium]|jgi:predicted dehydrogenase|nr:Gfo/Idh/MocA family oxidoreductase [Planctomycetaceae bacterium]
MTTKISRRMAIKTAATTTAFGLAALQTETSSSQIIGANERIRLGFIGIANRGSQLLDAFKIHADAEIAALCDVNTKTLGTVREKFGANIVAESDFRKLYEQKDLDAVVIATPDHWHAIQTVEACKAGKDVYCEKPLCVTVFEGRKMVEAARKYRRIVQVGIHRRSSPLYRELARQGADQLVGFVTVGRSFRPSNMFPNGIGKAEPTEPPKELDWNLWLGPRPESPYQTTIAPYKFRWRHLYSSQMGNWGVHFLDAMRWLLGDESPVSLCAMGGRYVIDDDRTVPDTAEVIFELPKGRLLSFCQYEACGNPCLATDERFRPLGEIELRGTNGTLYIDERKYLIKPEQPGQFQAKGERMKEVRAEGTGGGSNQWITELHARNFLDCVKSRELPNCDIETGHRSTSMSLLANISLAIRQRLDWNPEKEQFINNDTANQLLHYQYRQPWKLEI